MKDIQEQIEHFEEGIHRQDMMMDDLREIIKYNARNADTNNLIGWAQQMRTFELQRETYRASWEILNNIKASS